MKSIAALAVPAHGHSLYTELALLFSVIRRKWDEHMSVRKTIKELSALSQRELDDIGISRSDIPQIARTSCPR